MDNWVECIEKRESYSSLPENVDKFNLGNWTCADQSRKEHLKRTEKMDVRNIAEGEMSSWILADNA